MIFIQSFLVGTSNRNSESLYRPIL